MKMRNALAVVGLLMSITFNANALFIGDAYYMGQIVKGTPSSPANEVMYINDLLALSAGATAIGCSNGNDCDRIGSTLNVAGFDAAVLLGANADNDPSTPIDVTGYEYLYGKYGGFSMVWHVGDLSGSQILPDPVDDRLSHWALYNYSNSVPEPSTLLLLGLGFIGLGFARRRKA
jgi:hypothetical protein